MKKHVYKCLYYSFLEFVIIFTVGSMKKIVVAILAVLYLSTSMGATVQLHYCMGKLVSWSLGFVNSNKCSKCGMEKSHAEQKDGCCKDEYKQIKNDKDQKLTESAFYFNVVSLTSATSHFEIPFIYTSSITETSPVSNSPPGRQVEIYIRDHAFLI